MIVADAACVLGMVRVECCVGKRRGLPLGSWDRVGP